MTMMDGMRMKRKYLIIYLLGVLVGTILFWSILLTITGCNKDLIDTVYSYDYAIISLPNGQVVSGNVQNWTDYADGDQIQVTINDTTYLVHASNCVLIKH